jgi:glycerol-3-phosphate dehydrogenase (NAD(P)+)
MANQALAWPCCGWRMSRILVLGAGAWGTALAVHAARLGHDVALWARRPETIGAESARLPGMRLPDGVRGVRDVEAADACLVAVPMQHLRGVLHAQRPGGPLVLCCKGLELGSGLLPLEVAASVLPGRPGFVLSGPNFAREIAAGLPAASVLAGADGALRAQLLGMFGGGPFRLYGNADPVGVQLGGAAKNVIAIAAGAVIGAGLGENARAALVTRGVAEIARLIVALGGQSETAAGLSGLGDLVLTCTGTASRNFSLGLGLGRGESPALLCPPDGPVVEGVSTAPALLARAAGVDLPICAAVADLLAGRATLAEAVRRLLARPQRDE